MVGWHHRLDGHEFEQAPGVGDGQGSLACCSPWDYKAQLSLATRGEDWASQGQPKGKAEIPVVTRECRRNSRKTTWFCVCVCVCVCVKSLSHIRLFATPWTAACQASLSITNSRSLLKLMSIEWMMPSNHLILCHSLLLPPSIFPSISRIKGANTVSHFKTERGTSLETL